MAFDICKAANKRICIIGKFSDNQKINANGNVVEGPLRYYFNREPTGTRDQGHYRLSREDLFRALLPQLYIERTTLAMTIGETEFKYAEVTSPRLADAAADPFSVGLDSVLFEAVSAPLGADPMDTFVETGGRLYHQLLQHAHRMTQINSPNFARALLQLFRLRLAADANKKLNPRQYLSEANFQSCLLTDMRLRQLLMMHLFAVIEDENEIEGDIRQHLDEVANTTANNQAIFASDEKIRKEQIGKIVESLCKLKQDIRNHTPNQQHLVSGSRDGLLVTEIDIQQFKDYQNCSDWITRFTRNPILHSFVFCWLAARYDPNITFRGFGAAASTMAEIGIKSQGSRTVALPKATNATIRSLYIEKAQEAAKNAGLGNDDERDLVCWVKQLATTLGGNHFAPSFIFGQKELRERLEEMFVQCCETLAGPTKDIFDGVIKEYKEKSSEKFKVVVNSIEADKKERIDHRTDAEIRLEDLSDKFRIKIKETIKEPLYKELSKDNPCIRDFEIALAEKYGVDSFKSFIAKYKEDLSKIRKAKANYQKVYGDHRRAMVDSKDQRQGLPHVLGDVIIEDDQTSVAQWQSRAQAVATGSYQSEQPIVGNQSPVAGDSKTANPETVPSDKPSEAGDSKTTNPETVPGEQSSKVPDDSETANRSTSPASEPGEVVIPATVEKKTIAEELDDYDKWLTQLLGVYQGIPDDNLKRNLRRNLRALAVGEIVAAASYKKLADGEKVEKVKLGEADLGNITGLMLELLASLPLDEADEKNLDTLTPKNAFFKRPTTAWRKDAEAALSQLNLSRYYPFANDDLNTNAMANVVQYHRDVCNTFFHNVATHLRELREIGDLFKALEGSDIEVQVINKTLAEYDSLANNIGTADAFYYLHRQPLFLYATSAANFNADGLATTHYQNLKAIALPADGNPPAFPGSTLQLPVVLGPDYSAGLPSVCSKTVASRLPYFGIGGTPVNLTIQERPVLLWALAIFEAARSLDFGRTQDMSVSKRMETDRLIGGRWTPELTVAGYLQQCWKKPSEYSALLKFVKLINAALEQQAWQPGVDLRTFLQQRLDDDGWDSVFNGLCLRCDPNESLKIQIGKSAATGLATAGNLRLPPVDVTGIWIDEQRLDVNNGLGAFLARL